MENDEIDEEQECREFKRSVKDWGLSHTTLEEVFMKVTNKKISKYK